MFCSIFSSRLACLRPKRKKTEKCILNHNSALFSSISDELLDQQFTDVNTCEEFFSERALVRKTSMRERVEFPNLPRSSVIGLASGEARSLIASSSAEEEGLIRVFVIF